MARERLDETDIAREMATVEWAREGSQLHKTVTLGDFAEALAFVNRVGELSEQRDHHPDISISWNRVDLRLTTHSSGGLTAVDFDLARAVDALLGAP